MSAFIVDVDVMDRVIAGIALIDLRYHTSDAPMIVELAREPQKLGEALFAMNESAVRQRYPDDDSDYCDAPAYTCRGVAVSPVVAYKAISCLLYQCHEGEVPGSPLYKQLTIMFDALAHEIVQKLPAYEKAAWS